MATIQINDANFYYELHGKGEPLILIAGYTRDHVDWLPMLDELSKHFQVLIFDNRGCGQTRDKNVPLTVKLMADDVMAIAEALNLKQPYIVGASMGGTIAQTIAHDYSEKIGKLGLLCSSAKWRQAMLCGFKSLLSMREKNIDFDCLIDSTLPWVFGEDFFKKSENIATFKQAIINYPYPQSLDDQKRQFKVLEAFNGIAGLESIATPTFIAYGLQDLISLPIESEFIANQIQHAKLVEFDCAHAITFEQPKQLSKELVSFLKQ